MTDALNTASTPAAGASSTAAPPMTPKLSENLEKLRGLAAIIADGDGKTNVEAKQKAYVAVRRMIIDGAFAGPASNNQLVSPILDIVDQSAYGKRVDTLSKNYHDEVIALNQDGRLGEAQVEVLSKYSEEDQRLIYDNDINPVFSGGMRRYGDVESWKSNISAVSKVRDFMAKAKTDPAVKADPKYAEVEKLWMMADTSAPSWTALVLQLFGETPSSKLDLSDKARTVVGDVKPNAQPAPYEPGTVASKRV
ncbi:hypothetical protein GCM10010203_02140 [Actinomadura yumaensis]